MKLKKMNAVLGLLSVPLLLVHVGYNIYAYLAFYYNPELKLLTAVPFMVVCCGHAVCAMLSVFLRKDGGALELYPKQNRATVAQRITAALFFPLLIIHLNTYAWVKGAAEGGQWVLFGLLLFLQPVFYLDVMIHTASSFSRALVTLGILSSPERQRTLDVIVRVVCAAVALFAAFAVIRTELAMFLPAGGAP